MVESAPVTACSLPGLRHVSSGKVRENLSRSAARFHRDHRDRLSAFRCGHRRTAFRSRVRCSIGSPSSWFGKPSASAPHAHGRGRGDAAGGSAPCRGVRDRAMLVKKARPVSGRVRRTRLPHREWLGRHQRTGTICDIPLHRGWRSLEAPSPDLSPPPRRAATGHDENISFDTMTTMLDRANRPHARDLTLAIYQRGAAYAETRGLFWPTPSSNSAWWEARHTH